MNTGGESDDATCGGKEIAAVMHPYSRDLVQGCSHYAEMAKSAKFPQETLMHNTACVLFGASSIEAKLNERVSMAKLVLEGDKAGFWSVMASMKQGLSLQQKWNLIASHEGGTLWDSGKEPFQSFETVASLRNELVHYKGEFLPKDKAPVNRISGLMQLLGVKSNATFVEDDCSAWIHDLLTCRELGGWVSKKISDLDAQFDVLVGGRT